MRSSNIPYSERLDHLRFLAALMVISYHAFFPIYIGLTNNRDVPANPLTVFILNGYTAVGLFISLSGFLFARICLNGKFDIKQFYLNRILRIYPLYAGALLLAVFAAPATANIGSLFTSLLSFQTFPSAVKGVFADHLWSIGVEIQFYALFPVLLLAYRKSGLKYLSQAVLLCVAALVFIQWQQGAVRDIAYSTIVGRLPQAVIGMILGFTFDRYRKYITHPIALVVAITTASTALMCLHASGGHRLTEQNALWTYWPVVEAIFWGAVIACYQAGKIQIPEFVSKPLAHLGAMGYSIYVVHYSITIAVCSWFVKLLNTTTNPPFFFGPQLWMLQHPLETSLLAGFVLVLPPTLLVSFLTYNVIERPFMEFRRRYITPATPPVVSDVEHEAKELAYR